MISTKRKKSQVIKYLVEISTKRKEKFFQSVRNLHYLNKPEWINHSFHWWFTSLTHIIKVQHPLNTKERLYIIQIFLFSMNFQKYEIEGLTWTALCWSPQTIALVFLVNKTEGGVSEWLTITNSPLFVLHNFFFSVSWLDVNSQLLVFLLGVPLPDPGADS